MSRRGENIYKRKDGRWEGRYKNGNNKSGKTIYGSVYGKTYKEVKIKLTNIQKSLSQNSKSCSDPKFKEILCIWKESNRIRHKKSTELKYDYLIENHILPRFGESKISEIDTISLNKFMFEKMHCGRLDKEGGLSQSYLKSIMFIITSAIKFAVQENICKPVNINIYKPQIQKKTVKTLAPEEQKQLEKILLNDINPTKLGILISLRIGLRIGEICALRWSDVDLIKKILHVRATISRIKNELQDNGKSTILIVDKPKTESSARDIPIPMDLFNAFNIVKSSSVSDFIISSNNNFVSPRTFEYRYHKILKSSGINNINYHALRHTFATRCIEAGIDVKTLSELLGHTSISTTLNTYVHSSIEYKRSQLEKLSFFSS